MRFLESVVSLALIITAVALMSVYFARGRELPFGLFDQDSRDNDSLPVAASSLDEAAFKRGVVFLRVSQPGLLGCLFADSGSGTGFIAGRSVTQVVTAEHIVDGACSISVFPFGTGQGGQIGSAAILHADPVNDVAIIELDRPSPHQALPVGSSNDLQEFDTVCTAAYVKGGLQPPVMTCGRFLGRAPCGGATGLYFDADVLPGHSGAPLVNERGEVVGVVTQSSEAFFRGTSSCAAPIELVSGLRRR